MDNKNAIGVDCGTAHFVSCVKETKELTYQKQRNAFVKLPPSDDLSQNSLLTGGVSYIKKGEDLYVVGKDAIEYANDLGINLSRPMSKGAISSEEQEAIPIIRAIIKSILSDQLPSAEDLEKIKAGTLKKRQLVYSVPASAIDNPSINVRYHSEVLKEIFISLGFEPKPMNEALAIVYSELSDKNLNGIGISFGAGMMNICVAKRGIPITGLTFAIAKSGDWIDESSANASNETPLIAQTIKEGRRFSLTQEYDSGLEKSLSIFYNLLLKDHLVPILTNKFSSETFSSVEPIDVMVSGGTASVTGFLDIFIKHFPKTFKNKQGQIIKVGNIRLAKNSLFSVSTGCLYKAAIG